MANEHPDPETALYQALADVKEFKKQFKKEAYILKTQFGKLAKRVESLELLSFQDQLDCLHERITNLSNEVATRNEQTTIILLDLDRHIARLNLNLSLSIIALQFKAKAEENFSLHTKVEHCYEFIKDRAIAVMTEINHSQKPMAEYDKWCNICLNYLREQGVDVTF